MSKVINVGNIWIHAAAIVKLAMPTNAKRGDAFLFGVDAEGGMALIGPVDPEVKDTLPPGMKYVCGMTIDSTMERISVRLREATTQ